MWTIECCQHKKQIPTTYNELLRTTQYHLLRSLNFTYVHFRLPRSVCFPSTFVTLSHVLSKASCFTPRNHFLRMSGQGQLYGQSWWNFTTLALQQELLVALSNRQALSGFSPPKNCTCLRAREQSKLAAVSQHTAQALSMNGHRGFHSRVMQTSQPHNLKGAIAFPFTCSLQSTAYSFLRDTVRIYARCDFYFKINLANPSTIYVSQHPFRSGYLTLSLSLQESICFLHYPLPTKRYVHLAINLTSASCFWPQLKGCMRAKQPLTHQSKRQSKPLASKQRKKKYCNKHW